MLWIHDEHNYFILGHLQVQFTSSRLNHDMFKVVAGKVTPMGRSAGSLDVKRFEEPGKCQNSSGQAKPLNPNGYT